MTPVIYKWKLEFPHSWDGKHYRRNIPLRTIHHETIELPLGAEIVSVNVLPDPDGVEQLYLYTRQDSKQSEMTERHFIIQATGQPYSGKGRVTYLGTAVFNGGKEVGHVFEVTNMA